MKLPENPIEDSLVDEIFNRFMEEQQSYSSTHSQIIACRAKDVENSLTNQEPAIKQTVRVNRVTNNDVEINQDDDITADPTDDEIVNNIFDSGEVLMKNKAVYPIEINQDDVTDDPMKDTIIYNLEPENFLIKKPVVRKDIDENSNSETESKKYFMCYDINEDKDSEIEEICSDCIEIEEQRSDCLEIMLNDQPEKENIFGNEAAIPPEVVKLKTEEPVFKKAENVKEEPEQLEIFTDIPRLYKKAIGEHVKN